MNNNRSSNRRRGRGNNRQQGAATRVIGSTAARAATRRRLLEKYSKLAHDASLNGDRVQAEYYLQFADHYFRVHRRQPRAQRDEQRPQQRATATSPTDREPSSSYEEFRDEDEQVARPPRENGRDGSREGIATATVFSGRERQDNGRGEREQAEFLARRERPGATSSFEPAENPFNREVRGRRPEGERQGRSRGEASAEEAVEGEPGDEARFDPRLLPPSLSAAGE